MPATLASFSRASGPQREFAGVEEDVRHIHDQAAGRIAGLQNGVELLQQLDSQFHFLRFQLGLLFGGVVELGLAGRLCASFSRFRRSASVPAAAMRASFSSFRRSASALAAASRASFSPSGDRSLAAVRASFSVQAIGLGLALLARLVFGLQAIRFDCGSRHAGVVFALHALGFRQCGRRLRILLARQALRFAPAP